MGDKNCHPLRNSFTASAKKTTEMVISLEELGVNVRFLTLICAHGSWHAICTIPSTVVSQTPAGPSGQHLVKLGPSPA